MTKASACELFCPFHVIEANSVKSKSGSRDSYVVSLPAVVNLTRRIADAQRGNWTLAASWGSTASLAISLAR